MTRDFLCKCNRSHMQKCLRAYWELMEIYEEVCGGPSKAFQYREYVIARQTATLLRELLNELPE